MLPRQKHCAIFLVQSSLLNNNMVYIAIVVSVWTLLVMKDVNLIFNQMDSRYPICSLNSVVWILTSRLV